MSVCSGTKESDGICENADASAGSVGSVVMVSADSESEEGWTRYDECVCVSYDVRMVYAGSDSEVSVSEVCESSADSTDFADGGDPGPYVTSLTSWYVKVSCA